MVAAIWPPILSGQGTITPGWTWNRDATYFITKDRKTRTVKDSTVLRAFTGDELKLFLEMSGFESLEAVKEEASIAIVARKM